MRFSSPGLDIFILYRGVAAVVVGWLRIPLHGLVEVQDADASVGSLPPSFGTDEPAS